MTRPSAPLTHHPYRGYLIRWSVITLSKDADRVWVERDGHLICWANTVEQAKAAIDELTTLMVCAWCADSEERTRVATLAGLTVTHGCCPECSAKVVAS